MDRAVRILLVDDEQPLVLNMEKILKGRGFEVSTAFDGLQAIERFESQGPFDVVLLDIRMPGMDGLAVLREIKMRDSDVEVIMLTGHATVASGAEAMREGAYDYLMKPCEIEDLLEKIREAAETGSIKRQPVLWPRKTVGEIPLQPIQGPTPEDPLRKALQWMRREPGQEGIEELYLLDEEGRLKGYVTRRLLLDEAQKVYPGSPLSWARLLEDERLLPDKPIAEVMQPHPVTSHPGEALRELAARMILSGVRSVPVLLGGRAAGVIRMSDIFLHVDHEMQ